MIESRTDKPKNVVVVKSGGVDWLVGLGCEEGDEIGQPDRVWIEDVLVDGKWFGAEEFLSEPMRLQLDAALALQLT